MNFKTKQPNSITFSELKRIFKLNDSQLFKEEKSNYFAREVKESLLIRDKKKKKVDLGNCLLSEDQIDTIPYIVYKMVFALYFPVNI